MKILSLAHSYPVPPDDGSRVRISNIMSRLAKRHDVIMITSGQADSPGSSWNDVTFQLETYPPNPPSKSLLARCWRRLLSLAKGIPAPQLVGESAAMRQRIAALCAESWPDVVICEENASGECLRLVPRGIPSLWVKYSVMAIDAEQDRVSRSLGSAWVARRFERRNGERASLVVTVTEEDKEELRRRYRFGNVSVVPNGVDTDRFPWRADPGGSVVAFVGNFGWHANVDAVEWLISSIWPRVRGQVPGARLRLIGKGLDPRGLPSGLGIEPVGYVDDVAAALGDATVGVVPVRIGTGIRCKLLEFLSIGLASVSTGLGVHGLPLVDGEHVLIRSDPDGIAAAIVTLIEEPQTRRRITTAAFHLVSPLTWDRRVNQLDDLLQKLVKGPVQ